METPPRTPWLRALAVWALFIVAETLHGIARALWIEPRLGAATTARVGFLVGCLLTVVVPLACSRWLGARGLRACLAVGALWLVLTLAFEIALGRFVRGYGWDRIALEYRVDQGALMPFGLLLLALMPVVAARLRGPR